MLLEPVDTAKARQLLNQSMALVLAGGRGSRLKQLTDNRAKPAVHIPATTAACKSAHNTATGGTYGAFTGP